MTFADRIFLQIAGWQAACAVVFQQYNRVVTVAYSAFLASVVYEGEELLGLASGQREPYPQTVSIDHRMYLGEPTA